LKSKMTEPDTAISISQQQEEAKRPAASRTRAELKALGGSTERASDRRARDERALEAAKHP